MNPIDNKTRFESLSSALVEFGKGSTTEGSTSESQAKGYITSQDGNVHFVTNFSVTKKEKGLSLTKLAETIESVINAVANSATFEVKTDDTIDSMITGMEALKARISLAKDSSLWDKLLSSLGIETKYDVAIAKIDATINLAKTTFIPRQIALLKIDEELLESDIAKLTPTQNQFSISSFIGGKPRELDDLAKKQSEYEGEIGVLELNLIDLVDQNLQLEETKENLIAKKEKLIAEKEMIITKNGFRQLANEIERLEGINKKLNDQRRVIETLEKGVVGHFLSKAFGSSNQELNNAQSIKQQIKTEIKNQFGSVKNLEEMIKQKKEKLQSNPEIRAIEAGIKEVETKIIEIGKNIEGIEKSKTDKESKLKPLKAKLESVNNQLEKAQLLSQKKEQLASIKVLIEKKESQLKELEKPGLNHVINFFKLPENQSLDPVKKQLAKAFNSENRLLDSISAELGLVEGKIEQHANFLRLAMFGFSGQDINKESLGIGGNLSTIVEGGRAADNMFYVCHHFEKLLDNNNDQIKNSNYIQGIEKLQSDLIESLPFAFENTLIDTERGTLNLNERLNRYQAMSSNIRKKLQEMEAGQSLFIPNGVTGHQTLLVLKKEANNNVSTTFYNTGYGIEHNSPEREENIIQREYISRVYPGIDLTEKARDFESMMTVLFQIQSDEKKDVPDIHTALRETLGEGKAGRASEKQTDGVCSYQVLKEAFKDHLGKNYNQHRLDLLTDTQETFRAKINMSGAVTGNKEHVQFISNLDERLLAATGEEIKELQKKVKK